MAQHHPARARHTRTPRRPRAGGGVRARRRPPALHRAGLQLGVEALLPGHGETSMHLLQVPTYAFFSIHLEIVLSFQSGV